jgi:hypothetical protein
MDWILAGMGEIFEALTRFFAFFFGRDTDVAHDDPVYKQNVEDLIDRNKTFEISRDGKP